VPSLAIRGSMPRDRNSQRVASLSYVRTFGDGKQSGPASWTAGNPTANTLLVRNTGGLLAVRTAGANASDQTQIIPSSWTSPSWVSNPARPAVPDTIVPDHRDTPSTTRGPRPWSTKHTSARRCRKTQHWQREGGGTETTPSPASRRRGRPESWSVGESSARALRRRHFALLSREPPMSHIAFAPRIIAGFMRLTLLDGDKRVCIDRFKFRRPRNQRRCWTLWVADVIRNFQFSIGVPLRFRWLVM
jgi:hypothetical protein